MAKTSSKALKVGTDKEEIAFPLVLNRAERDLIRNHIAPDASAGEFALFIYDAQSRGLNPLKKQIYFVKYGGKPSHQVAIDGYRALAVRTGCYDGSSRPTYGDPQHSKFDKDLTIPEWVEVTVHRKGCQEPFTVRIYFDEFVQVFSGKISSQWKQRPYHMIAKCAEALALRKAFPEELSGLTTTTEMGGTEDSPADYTEETTVAVKEAEPEPVVQKSFDIEGEAPVNPNF